MKIYHVTEIELVTRRFRVIADSEEQALEILGEEMDYPQVTANCELIDQSTTHSNVTFTDTEVME